MDSPLPAVAANPLLEDWNTPHGLPPFERIRAEHFVPAFAAAMAAHRADINAIGSCEGAPTFANTVLALDRCGALYLRISLVFNNLRAAETSPALQAAERELAPQLAAHDNFIFMHAALFRRLDAVHAQRNLLGLDAEQVRLVERFHLDFVRAGARLAGAGQQRYAEITQRLAALTTTFNQNLLADESTYRLKLRDEAELAGLPAFVRAAARQAAEERGEPGYLITLSRSHVVPFLTFSARRDLREQAYRSWLKRGEMTTERNNLTVAREILELRLEQARLHGYRCFADYALADTMAGTQQAVTELLNTVWTRGKARAGDEAGALQALAAADGITLEAWDWAYYAEKVRQQRYALEESTVKPYFPLERMVDAIFDCAQRLFGLRFVPQPALRAYHPDVKVYEVRDADDELAAVFLHDNFARATKRGGAWMSNYRLQRGAALPGEQPVVPIVANHNNFAKGAPGEPTLLSFDDARTLFHEFGHGLHGMLSQVRFQRLSCTQVLRDFVELPSQLFEHWLAEPAVLQRHARHYQTGAPIPDALIDRLIQARNFNRGFEAVTYTASALVDMALHGRTSMEDLDLAQVERDELARIGMPRELAMRHRLPHFQHLFGGASYASAYYVYLWAEVLDADAFDAFTEAGDPFDAAVAARLKACIYSSGNSRPPMEAYEAFRGRPPTLEPMLKKKGLAAV